MKPLWIAFSLFAAFATAVQFSANEIKQDREAAMKGLAPRVASVKVKIPDAKRYRPIKASSKKGETAAPALIAPTAPQPVQTQAPLEWRLVGISDGAQEGMAFFVIGDAKRHVKPGTEIEPGVKVLSVEQNFVRMDIHGEVVDVTPW